MTPNFYTVTRKRNEDAQAILDFRAQIAANLAKGYFEEAPKMIREYVTDTTVFGAFSYMERGLILVWFRGTDHVYSGMRYSSEEAKHLADFMAMMQDAKANEDYDPTYDMREMTVHP